MVPKSLANEQPFTKSSERVLCHTHSERPCPVHLGLLTSGPTMTVLTRFTAIHVITRTMRRDSLLGTQSPLTYAAQDGQLHPEVIRLLTAVVVAKSAAASAAVNKFPSYLEDYHTLLLPAHLPSSVTLEEHTF